MTPQLFITINLALLTLGLVLAIVVSILAARHTWMVGYGPEQGRLRTWLAFVLIIFVILAISAAVFNLAF